MAAGVTMMITYGHKVKSKDDEFIAIADKGVATIEAAGAVGAHIVDFVPWLRFIPDWFPGAGIKRLPPGTRENLQAFLHVPFDGVKKRMVCLCSIRCLCVWWELWSDGIFVGCWDCCTVLYHEVA